MVMGFNFNLDDICVVHQRNSEVCGHWNVFKLQDMFFRTHYFIGLV